MELSIGKLSQRCSGVIVAGDICQLELNVTTIRRFPGYTPANL